MANQDVINIVERQRRFFKSGFTLPYTYRLVYLEKLKQEIINNLDLIYDCLYRDLGKSKQEAYMTEIGIVLDDLSYFIKNLKKLVKPQRYYGQGRILPSKGYMKATPYGSVLVMSSWTYPFMLALVPTIEAIAAGNTVLLKLNSTSPFTSQAVIKIISKVFDSEYCHAISGGKELDDLVINLKFDYAFYTGSKEMGKMLYEAQARYLTPVTLELGGKNPVIVDKSSDLNLAAKRIVFGKFLNAGQTGIAPDYVFCHFDVKKAFIYELINEIKLQFGEEPLDNPDYGRIVNRSQFDRLLNLINPEKLVYGGGSNDQLKIEPTILDNASDGDLIMHEEIMGPILPIMSFLDINDVIEYVNINDAPQAIYIFSNNKNQIDNLTTRAYFGGCFINDAVIPFNSSRIPFGGYRESGLGAYGGKNGFDCFSHYKGIVKKDIYTDLECRYQPYSEKKFQKIKKNIK